eukprot:CAMPEP_0183600406 /NCGR_PEP_ID=MMETSP0371-20130417/179919_1 /TAXON_ID=268820 /ORGANISM="Peridinium aciculiferum, Strain PAER-2" /LENGTH=212 /DNA_ID=CAMNT_0025812483 /DNA_START=340 /DNA_END=974 /DNA_ORIENTATION=+
MVGFGFAGGIWHSLQMPTVLLLVHAPSAESDGRVRLRRRHLALAPNAALGANRAAEDAIDHGRLDVSGAAAAELLELRGEEALVHLVDTATAAEAVVDPERLLHDLGLLEETRRKLSGSEGSAALLVEARDGWGILDRRQLALLGDAQANLDLVAEAVLAHDVGRRRGRAQAELFGLGANQGIREGAETPALAAAIDQPLGVVDDLRLAELA